MRATRVFVLLAVLSVSSLSFADKAPKEWRDRYSAIQDAVNKRHAAGFISFLDKSFVQIGLKGVAVRYPAYTKGIQAYFNGMTDLKTRLIAASFRKKGNEVEIGYEFTVNATQRGQNGAGARISYVEMGTDTWRKIGGQYRMVKEQVKSLGPIPKK